MTASKDQPPDSKVGKKLKAEISDENFEFKTFKFDDPIVTAAQVAEAFGAKPQDQFKVLQQLETGEIETKRPTETTDLRDSGLERFFVIRSDRTFGFSVDGLAMEWPLPSILGEHLRTLAHATDCQELVRVTADGLLPVEDDDVVSFAESGTEEFRLTERKRTVTIKYGDEKFEVERRAWTTEELIALFGVPQGHILDLVVKREFKPLESGQKIKVHDCMVFTSHVPIGQSS